MKPSNPRLAACVAFALILGVAAPVLAQSAGETAAIEARLMARLEQRLAEENDEQRAEQEATRLAFQQSVHALAQSNNTLERRALVAIDSGHTRAGLQTLEELARTRDVATPAGADPHARQLRSDEWRRIGALAFLDNTQRAVDAYEHALTFDPNDAVALDQLAWLYGRQARIDDATRVSRRLASLDDPDARTRGLLHLADIQIDAQDARHARPLIEQAITLARQNHLSQQEAMAEAFLGASYLNDNDFDEAQRHAESALTLSRANGFQNEEAFALYIQGTISFVRGTSRLFGRRQWFVRADQSYAAVQAIYQSLHDDGAVAQVLIRRGHVANLMEDYPLAETRLREAIATLERLHLRARLGFAQQKLGVAIAAQGRADEAIPLFTSAVDIAHETNQPAYEANALFDWAGVESRRGNSAEACRLARQGSSIADTTPALENQRGALHTMTGLYCLGQSGQSSGK